MTAYLASLTGLDKLFFLCAFTGGLFFLARMALSALGMGHHDADLSGLDHDGFDGNFHHDGADGGGDSDASFKILSLQGLTVFFMVFGLLGLTLHRGAGWGEFASLYFAMAGGVFMMIVVAVLFHLMRGLQSIGNENIRQAVGCSGTVYLTIPAGGTGKVQLVFDNHLREMDATAHTEEQIKTGERVRVVDVIDGGILVVEKCPKAEGAEAAM